MATAPEDFNVLERACIHNALDHLGELSKELAQNDEGEPKSGITEEWEAYGKLIAHVQKKLDALFYPGMFPDPDPADLPERYRE